MVGARSFAAPEYGSQVHARDGQTVSLRFPRPGRCCADARRRHSWERREPWSVDVLPAWPKATAVVQNVRTIADRDACLGAGKRAGLHAADEVGCRAPCLLRAREGSPTAEPAEQLVCTLPASGRILPVCLGRLRGQWLGVSAHPSLASCSCTNSERHTDLRERGQGGLSRAQAVYIWLPASLLRPSGVHKPAYHARKGNRSFTSLACPRLIHRSRPPRPQRHARHPREAQLE